MKKYLEFVNEGIFDFLKGGKKLKKRKYKYASDRDMGELIDEIVATFDPEKFEWDKDYNNWTYELNGVKIVLTLGKYGRGITVKIDHKELATELVSDEILEELLAFFKKKEIQIKTSGNSGLFNKTIKSRIDSEKYNM